MPNINGSQNSVDLIDLKSDSIGQEELKELKKFKSDFLILKRQIENIQMTINEQINEKIEQRLVKFEEENLKMIEVMKKRIENTQAENSALKIENGILMEKMLLIECSSAIKSPVSNLIDTKDNENVCNFYLLPHNFETLMAIYNINKSNFNTFESTIGYKFVNKAYLVQAFTHASCYNGVIVCNQHLEFFGDKILDFLITRFLFGQHKYYSRGELNDIICALVNNIILASIVVKNNFHKYFLMLSPQLYEKIEKFANFCKQRDFSHCANFNEILMQNDEEIDENNEEEEDVETPPRPLADLFESIVGAIYLDCRNLDEVWRIFYNLMGEMIEECCENPPITPIRELQERKNCHVKYEKIERNLGTDKLGVTVTVNDDLQFTGMGRNYRIAKLKAAKKALIHLKKLDKAESATGS